MTADRQALRSKYKSLNPLISHDREVRVPMVEMWVYPVRGVRSKGPVDSIEVGEFGTRYDREIILATRGELKVLGTHLHQPMGVLI